jgi:hypothetical protein
MVSVRRGVDDGRGDGDRHLISNPRTSAAAASGDLSGERFRSCVQFPVKGPEGDPAGVVHIMGEITQRARNERRPALADLASARIGTALDTTRTAEELLEVAVPGLADVGAVDLLATVIEGDNLARRPSGGAGTLARLGPLAVGEACDSLLATLAPNPADDVAVLMART